MSRYRVFKAYCAWHVYECGPKRYETFTTWAKAMEYANRQAQPTPNTITIADRSGALCDITATVINKHRISLRAGDDTFILASHEWKPLAHFLLDAARSQEEA